MKISELGDGGLCRFDDIGDNYAGTVVEEPKWTADNFDEERRMLVVLLDTQHGVYELRARRGMLGDIRRGLDRAGAKELGPGGWLSIEYTEKRGNAKVYHVNYEAPEDNSGSAAGDDDCPF